MDLCLRQEVPPNTRKWPFFSSRSMESHLIPTSDRKWPLCLMDIGLLIPWEIQPGIVWLSDKGKGASSPGECGWSFLENNQWSQRKKEGRSKCALKLFLPAFCSLLPNSIKMIRYSIFHLTSWLISCWHRKQRCHRWSGDLSAVNRIVYCHVLHIK